MTDHARRAAEKIAGKGYAGVESFVREAIDAAVAEATNSRYWEGIRADNVNLKARAERAEAEYERLRGVVRRAHDRCDRQARLLIRACTHVAPTQSLWKEIDAELRPEPTTDAAGMEGGGDGC